MFDSMRSTAKGDSQLTGAFLRSLEETGNLSISGMRQAGFRALEQVMDEAQLRTAAPLPERSQVLLDKAVIGVGMQRLSFVADLISEGLVYNLPDPLSVTQLEWNKSNKIGAAQRTMSPSARGENKLPILLPGRIPIYLTTDQFEIDIRTLKMSQRVGMPLDVSMAAACTRAVNEAIEDAAINGATTLDGQALYDSGYSCPGLLNAPNANTLAITTAAWTSVPVGTTILAQTLAAIDKLQADKKYGPYNLYVGTIIGNVLQGDFSTAKGDLTIRQRLEQVDAGGRKLKVRTTDFLPAATAVLIQMTSDVVDVIDGQRPTVIPWSSLDGFTVHNLVLACVLTRFRSDYDSNSGVCVIS